MNACPAALAPALPAPPIDPVASNTSDTDIAQRTIGSGHHSVNSLTSTPFSKILKSCFAMLYAGLPLHPTEKYNSIVGQFTVTRFRFRFGCASAMFDIPKNAVRRTTVARRRGLRTAVIRECISILDLYKYIVVWKNIVVRTYEYYSITVSSTRRLR